MRWGFDAYARAMLGAAAVAAAVLIAGCASGSDPAPKARIDTAFTPKPYVELKHPEWAKDAAIYQLNVRQFTQEGTFKAAQKHLPRIKELGAEIVWLMPIHPIGEKNRKGSLGSYYSVKDYYGVNPEFGSLQDLKEFVKAAHALDLKVILDWVANHTAWDNPLVAQHPEWYERDWKGDFHPTPWWDWSDIIDLNYDQAGLREYMTKAMVYWVKEADIDGYRCDVAGYVPLDFWEQVRAELDKVKPVFMLAEFEERDVHKRAFDASYAWGWNNAMHSIAMGNADTGALFGFYSGHESAWPRDAYRLTYVSNHDQNSWTATQSERFGPALQAAIVLSVVGEGMPMIYSGQEAGETKRLKFFEKDPIEWKPHPIGDLYRALFQLKRLVPALWNGASGARMVPVVNSAPSKVLSFVRADQNNGVFAVLNLSKEAQTVRFQPGPHYGAYAYHLSGGETVFTETTTLTIEPWGWRVFVRKRPAP